MNVPDARGMIGGHPLASLFWTQWRQQCFLLPDDFDVPASEWCPDRETVPFARGPPLGTPYCVFFEMFTEANRVICPVGADRSGSTPHTDGEPALQRAGLFVHGVRNMATGLEEDYEAIAKRYRWACVDSPPSWLAAGGLDLLIAAASAISPCVGEGFVVVDREFRRVKAGSPVEYYVRSVKCFTNPVDTHSGQERGVEGSTSPAALAA